MLKKLIDLLTPYERKRARVLMSMILAMAFLDMLGVASILPFMAVLANPELVQTNAVLNTAFTTSRHIGTTEQFLFVLGVCLCAAGHLAGFQGTHHLRANPLCADARIQHRQASGGILFAHEKLYKYIIKIINCN